MDGTLRVSGTYAHALHTASVHQQTMAIQSLELTLLIRSLAGNAQPLPILLCSPVDGCAVTWIKSCGELP
jgi:hypothetical protein